MAVLSEEQRMLRDAAESWARERAPVTAFRRLRDAGAPLGYDPALYREIAEMGWAGILVPEAYGGCDFGHPSMGLVLEALGRTLTASPLVSTAVAGVSAFALGGTDAQRGRWLPALAAGEAVAALAVDEGARHAPAMTALAAVRTGAGWRLDGIKRPVLHGMAADLLVVAARTGGRPGDADGITLFLVGAGADGVSRAPLQEIERRGAALVRFDGVAVGDDAVLGAPGEGGVLLDRVLDRARAAVAAELLGSSTQAFHTTLDYLKTRVQFGQIIGRFQALQHRAAVLYGELELARSAVEAALAALDEEGPDTPALVSLAKALAGDTARRVAAEMIQLHGGIGMTDEHDAGFYLKRARVGDMSYGNAAFHRERYAVLNGY